MTMRSPFVPTTRISHRWLTGIAVPAAVLAVSSAIYLAGAHHSPDYGTDLFGRHGVAVVRLKAQIATVVLRPLGSPKGDSRTKIDGEWAGNSTRCPW